MISDGGHAEGYSRAASRVTIVGEYGVGQAVDIDLSDYGATPTVKGLPVGLTYNATTKHITGRPTKSGASTVSVTAKQADGTTVTRTFVITVEAFPTWASGVFTALVSAPEPTDVALTGLGGVVGLNILDTGAYTGTLRLGAKTYPLRGQLAGMTSFARGDGPLVLPIVVQTEATNRASDITLNLAFRPQDAADSPGLSGTLTYKGNILDVGPGWKHVWSATNPAWGNRDRTLNVVIGNTGTTGPGGRGFATVKLLKSGVAQWSGTLADGRIFTGSFTASPDGRVPLYVAIPYTGGGCVMALLDTALASDMIRVATPAESNGYWGKRGSASTSDRSYRSGFDLDVSISGAEYKAPASGQLLFGATAVPQALDLDLDGAGVDATSAFTAFESGGVVSLDAQLRTGNVIAMVQSGLTASMSASFATTTGLFSGSAKFTDVVAGKAVIRTLTLNGLYIPDPDNQANSAVAGYLLLPELPAAGQSATTTPIGSGTMWIGK